MDAISTRSPTFQLFVAFTVEAAAFMYPLGGITAGFVAAIERCGAVLATYAPPDGTANELPDRLYVI